MTPAYAGMMRLLHDQDALAHGHVIATVESPLVPAVVHEPCIRINPEAITIGEHSRIDSFVKLEGGDGLTIGQYVHIASLAHVGIGGGTTILEDGSAVASGGKVISGSNRPEGESMSAAMPRDRQVIRKYTTRIGKNATVCTNAVVLPGVTLGEGSVLGAGSVATKDIPPFEIWAGVPAVRVSVRKGHPEWSSEPVEASEPAPRSKDLPPVVAPSYRAKPCA